MAQKKALSPVVASIILIAVTVGVSIGVAWWMGALTFSFTGSDKYSNVTITVPPYQNATYAHAWIDYPFANSGGPQQLPFNLTIGSTSHAQFTLKVVYYSMLVSHQVWNTTVYEFAPISDEIHLEINLNGGI